MAALKLLKKVEQPAPGDDPRVLMRRLQELGKLETKIGQLALDKDRVELLRTEIGQRRQEAQAALDQNARRVAAQLEEVLRPLGMALSGHAPDLRCGFFTVELNPEPCRARLWYGPKQEQLCECPLSAREIARLLQKAKESLGTSLGVRVFVERLYKACCRAGHGRGGQGAPIIEVLAELAPLLQGPRYRADPRAEHYKGYGRADFSYDLFQAWRGQPQASLPSEFRLVVATRAFTKRREDFLWVPDDETSGKGTTYSHIQFAEGIR